MDHPSKARLPWHSYHNKIVVLGVGTSGSYLIYQLSQGRNNYVLGLEAEPDTSDCPTAVDYSNPSQKNCDRWASILQDDRYTFQNLFPINRGIPSPFSINLSNIVYEEFHDVLGFRSLKLTPTIAPEPLTVNSGANICITTAAERCLDQPSTLLGSVITKQEQRFCDAIEYGVYRGINNHNLTLKLNTRVSRIVFKTKVGYPHGKDYWLCNYPLGEIKKQAFVRPLKAVGVVYISTADNRSNFVRCTDTILCLGTLATPTVLMQSGIGPKAILDKHGLPVLFNQANLGKHIGNQYGLTLTWSGNNTVWGGTTAGTDASSGYLPNVSQVPTSSRRKFQYFSSHQATPETWSLSLYDLHPKSTGHLEISDVAETGGLIKASIYPNYYSDTNGEDLDNLCNITRKLAAMIKRSDPTAEFITAAASIPYPFPADNAGMFKLFSEQAASLVSHANYAGSCGMGTSEKYHCVDSNFLLRGTSNVYVCDAASTPLEVTADKEVYPVQNDGSAARDLNAFSIICAETLHEILDRRN